MCLCARQGFGLLCTESGFTFQKPTKTAAHGCHPESVISINYSPARASQGPCIEPDGQQSTPCGSTTVQRPMLTGKRVVLRAAAGGETFGCRALPCPTLQQLPPKQPQLRATQGRLKRCCSNPPTWLLALIHLPYMGQQDFICMFCTS